LFVLSIKKEELRPATITQEAIKKSPNTFEKLVNMSAKIMSEKKTGAYIFGDKTLFSILMNQIMSLILKDIPVNFTVFTL
jgi:precorrin-4 methylase